MRQAEESVLEPATLVDSSVYVTMPLHGAELYGTMLHHEELI